MMLNSGTIAAPRGPMSTRAGCLAGRIVQTLRRAGQVASPVGRATPSTTCHASAPLEIPTRLNTIPHPRETRYWFYNDVVAAVETAVFDTPPPTTADPADPNLISVFCSIPELNPAYDVYRVGSLLECVREVSTSLSKRGKKVKVAVQQSLGEGVFCGMPLALSGVKRLLLQMDWGEDTPVSIGEGLGREEIVDCDSYILIAPQNLQVGTELDRDVRSALHAPTTTLSLTRAPRVVRPLARGAAFCPSFRRWWSRQRRRASRGRRRTSF